MSRRNDEQGALVRFREFFPVTKELIYVDIATRSPLSTHVRAAVERHLDECQSGLILKSEWFDRLERVRARVASLVNAKPSEIAFVKSTSDGINAVLTSIDWSEGDNAVICPAFEHPNNIYPWLNLERRGVEIRRLALKGPTVRLQDISKVVDAKTRAIGVASVSYATGRQSDLVNIGQYCRDRQVLLIADVAQSLGALNIDVNEVLVDAFSAPINKSLLGLYGLGVLFCRNADMLQPAYLSVFGVDTSTVAGGPYKLASGAGRFEVGNYNYLAIDALGAGLDHILEAGIKHIEAHVLNLAGTFTRRLLKLGYDVKSSTTPGDLTHLVVFSSGAGGPPIGEISRQLTANRIVHTVKTRPEGHPGRRLEPASQHTSMEIMERYGIRVSFHLYNDMSEVDYLLDVLRRV